MQKTLTFSRVPYSGTFRFSAGMAMTSEPIDWFATVNEVQAALESIAPETYTASIYWGSVQITWDDEDPEPTILSSVRSLADRSTVTVEQTGIYPDVDVPFSGQVEIVALELLDAPVAGFWLLKRDGQAVGRFRYDAVAAEIAAALGTQWGAVAFVLESGDPVQRYRLTSASAVAPSVWAIESDATEPLLCACGVTIG